MLGLNAPVAIILLLTVVICGPTTILCAGLSVGIIGLLVYIGLDDAPAGTASADYISRRKAAAFLIGVAATINILWLIPAACFIWYVRIIRRDMLLELVDEAADVKSGRETQKVRDTRSPSVIKKQARQRQQAARRKRKQQARSC